MSSLVDQMTTSVDLADGTPSQHDYPYLTTKRIRRSRQSTYTLQGQVAGTPRVPEVGRVGTVIPVGQHQSHGEKPCSQNLAVFSGV